MYISDHVLSWDKWCHHCSHGHKVKKEYGKLMRPCNLCHMDKQKKCPSQYRKQE